MFSINFKVHLITWIFEISRKAEINLINSQKL
jgi:hypothetical protein